MPKLWDHFKAVCVPEIERYHATNKEEETSVNPVVQCMMEFAEYCQSNSANSEVRNIITSLYHVTYV